LVALFCNPLAMLTPKHLRRTKWLFVVLGRLLQM
jgi:hypothetical protein